MSDAGGHPLREALGRLGRHTAVYAVTGQMSRIVGFVLIHFYTKWFGQTLYGQGDLLTHLITVLSYLAGSNLTTAMARYYFEQADERGRRAVVSTTLVAGLIAAVGVAGLCALGAVPIAALLSPGDSVMPQLVRVSLAILVLQLLRETWLRYLQSEERSTTYGVIMVSKVVVEVSLQVWFVAGLDLGLPGQFYGVLASEALTLVVLSALLLPKVGLTFSRPLFGLMLAYSLPLIPNGILQFCLHSGDRFILNALAGNAQVGIYAFAYRFGQIPLFLLITPFLLIWYPFVFALRDEARQQDLIARVAPWMMAALTAVVLGEALFARELATVMAGQPDFVAAWPAIGLVCAGYWFWGLFQVVQTGFYVRKATRRLPLLTAVAVVVNFGANFALIPRLGFMGAAWATLLAFLVLCVITERAVRTVFPVPWPWKRIVLPAAGALAVYAAGMSLEPVAHLAPGPAQAAVKVLLLVGWASWIWAGGFLRKD